MKTSSFSLMVLSILFTTSCGGSSKQQNERTEKIPVNDARSTSAVRSYYINDVNNTSIGEIEIDGEEVNIRLQNSELFGILKRADKRKYYNQADEVSYTVKYSPDGFKLRDGNEALLWKVKMDEESIKIADNEEMQKAFKIKVYDGEKIKLKREEKELAALRFGSENSFITIDDRYLVRNFGSSSAMGLFLIDELTDAEKVVLSAEVLNYLP